MKKGTAPSEIPPGDASILSFLAMDPGIEGGRWDELFRQLQTPEAKRIARKLLEDSRKITLPDLMQFTSRQGATDKLRGKHDKAARAIRYWAARSAKAK